MFYQENRSFDSVFGTFPKAEGLFSSPAAQTPGFYQQLINTDGSVSTIHPFRIGPSDMCPLSTVNGTLSPATCYAADTDDVDHSHTGIVTKMDIESDMPKMDLYAVTEERNYVATGNPTLQAKQAGELTMAPMRIAIRSRCFGDTPTSSWYLITFFRRTLPDEFAARQIGEEEFGQKDLGPQDAITEGITDLLGAFSPLRLTGVADPLPPYYLEVPEYYVRNLPQKTGYGCADLGIIITDRAKGIVNQIPTDFNPRPDTNPTPTK